MSFLKARNWQIMAVVAVVALALTLTLGAFAPQASAAGHEFDINIYHGINGRALGHDKELPVDILVYVEKDGVLDLLATFEDVTFKQRLSTTLDPGTYKFDVNFANTPTTIMSFGPAPIPGGVTVDVHAKLSAEKTPTLKVKVK